MRRLLPSLWLALMLALVVGPPVVAKGASCTPRGAVLILVPGLDWTTVDHLPALHTLSATGQVAALNVKQIDSGVAAPYFSLGAGGRTPSFHLAPPVQGGEVLDWNQVRAAARRSNTPTDPAWLGERLRGAWLPTYAFGGPEALWLLADANGMVDGGSGNPLPASETAFWEAVGLPHSVTAAVWHAPYDAAFNAFVDRLAGQLPAQCKALWIVSPTPLTLPSPTTGIRGLVPALREDDLTPLLTLHPGASPGWLAGPTTRRPGLIANEDLAPTLATWLGVLDPNAPLTLGRPAHAVPRAGAWPAVEELHARALAVDKARRPVIEGWLLVLMANLIIYLVLLTRGRHFGAAGWTRWLAAFPLAFLLLAALPEQPWWALALEACLVAALAWPLAAWQLASATWVALVVDTLLGAPLQRFSLLGYSMESGARYYGMGNEYMGLLVGAALLTAPALARRAKRGAWWGAIVYLITVAVLALPQLGANFGGAITAGLALGLACPALWRRGRSQTTDLLWMGAALIAALGAMLGLEFWHVGPASHVGRLLELVLRQGWTPLRDVIVRKLELNLWLITVSLWSKVFIVSLLVLGLAAWRLLRRYAWPDLYGRPWLWYSVRLSLLASLVALLVNDSGIVAAATTLLLPVTALIEATVSKDQA